MKRSLAIIAAAVLALAPGAPAALVVHLAFDTAGTTIVQNEGTTGGANDGFLNGDSQQILSGKLSGCAMLDGNQDWISAGTSPIAGTAARTSSIWVLTTATALETALAYGFNGNGTKWDIDVDGLTDGGTVEIGAGGGRSVGQGQTVNDGNWHLVTTVLPVGGANLNQTLVYVDGVFQYTPTTNRTVSTNAAAASGLYVGCSLTDYDAVATGFQPGFQSFSGLLDDAAIWDQDLGPARIRAVFELGNRAGVDAGGAGALFESFDGDHGDVLAGGLEWTYRTTGLGGAEGEVVSLGHGLYSLNLGAGSGLVTVPEPASGIALWSGATLLTFRRRRS